MTTGQETLAINSRAIAPAFAIQPSASNSIGSYTGGIWKTILRDGTTLKQARGLEVVSTSTGGNLVVHMIDDYDSAGAKVYLTYAIPASNEQIGRAHV